jgi:hypothetical protein
VEDIYEQVHVIRRNGKLEYRCAYQSFGYELGVMPQETGSLDHAVESMMVHYKENGRKLMPGSRFEGNTFVAATEDEARQYWRTRAEDIAATEEEDRFYDLDAFRDSVLKVSVDPYKHLLLKAEVTMLTSAADYVTHELDLPLEMRLPFGDERELDHLIDRVETIAEEGPISSHDASAITAGLEYVKNLKFAYGHSSLR